MAAIVKTVGGLALASLKSFSGIVAANLKSINGQDATSGGGATGAAVDLLVDYTSGSGAVSPTNIAAAEVGGISGSWTYIPAKANPLLLTTIETMSVTRKWPLSCLGADHQTVSRVIKMTLTTGSDFEGLIRSIPAGHPNVTQTILVNTDADDASGLDVIHIDGGNYAVGQIEGGHFNSHSQTGAGTTRGRPVTIPDKSKWYIYTGRYNSDGDLAELIVTDNDSGDVVIVSEADGAMGGFDATAFYLQNYLIGTGTLRIALIALSLDGEFPLDPVTLPAPTDFTLEQTGVSEVTLTWTGITQRTKIQRQTGAGAFSDLAANFNFNDSDLPGPGITGLGPLTYIDTTATTGSTYTYRLYALGAGLTSSAATGSPIAVDDTAPTLSSATINTAGTTLTLVLSESVTLGDDGGNDFALTASGGSASISYSSGSGTGTLVYTTGRNIAIGETVTIAYTQPGDGVKNLRAIVLADFSGTSVTNNSTAGGGGSLIIDEPFDGTGTPSGWFNSGADFDSTVSPLEGTQNLRCPDGSFVQSPTINESEIYIKFPARFSALPASFSLFCISDDSSYAVDLLKGYILASGALVISDHSGGVFETTVATLSAGTAYDIEMHYSKGTGSNGVCSIAFVAAGGTMPTSGSAFAGASNSAGSTNVDHIKLLGSGGIPNTDFGSFKVSASFI